MRCRTSMRVLMCCAMVVFAAAAASAAVKLPAQTVQTLCSFNYSNGQYPVAALTLGNDGNFYGTTSITLLRSCHASDGLPHLFGKPGIASDSQGNGHSSSLESTET